MIDDLLLLLGFHTPAFVCLIRREYNPDELLSLIEAVFTNKNFVGDAIAGLNGDELQSFIDTMYEVRPVFVPRLGTC